MPNERWRVALVDSGIGSRPVAAAVRFVDTGEQVIECDCVADSSGHGSAIAEIICSQLSACELLVAQVLNENGRTTPATVAAGIRWAIDRGAQLIHLSLGLGEDRAVLAASIRAAIDAGMVVVASTPARGIVSYPARYPGVIRATGDARCHRDEVSCLATADADFGACALHQTHLSSVMRGASVGAAHLTRFIVGNVCAGSACDSVRSELSRRASYHGRESRAAVTT